MNESKLSSDADVLQIAKLLKASVEKFRKRSTGAEPEGAALRELRREAGGYVFSLAEAGALNTITDIGKYVEGYKRTSNLSNEESKWYNEDTAKRELFDKVIGYVVHDEQWGPGVIQIVAPFLQTFPNNGVEVHLQVTTPSIVSACQKLIELARGFASQKQNKALQAPLTQVENEILEAMIGLGANVDCVLPRDVIMRKINSGSDGKDAFRHLGELGLVDSKKGTGYYLTTHGELRANRIIAGSTNRRLNESSPKQE